MTVPRQVFERITLVSDRTGLTLSELVSESLRKYLPEVWQEVETSEQTFKDILEGSSLELKETLNESHDKPKGYR